MALTQAQKRLLQAAQEVAKALGPKGRGLTGLIGELSACEKANLTWEPSDSYDATSAQFRFQIKTRKSWSTPGVNPKGRLGRFGTKKGYPFDVALYVELDDEFQVGGMWRMRVDKVKACEDVEPGNRGLHVSTFVNNAEPGFMS
jgi:hypothetical protein